MTPTTPIDPRQQVDQTFAAGVLVEEIVHNYPPNGGGTRRWVDDQGEHSQPVTGLPVPVVPTPTPEQRLAAVASALDGLAAPVLSADVVAAIREALA